MVILRSAYDTECKSTFSDVHMAPVSYCTSLVRIIYVSVCVHSYVVLVTACMEAHGYLHMVTFVHTLWYLNYVCTAYASCETWTLHIL